MPECVLVVRRTSSDDIQIRDLIVQVDHLSDFNLKYGAQREMRLEPGEHTLSVTNRLYTKKITFTLRAGEASVYQVVNYASGCLAAFFMGLGMGLYKVRITPEASPPGSAPSPRSE